MLTKNQFEVLNSIEGNQGQTQREIAKDCGISLGSVSAAVRELRDMGCLENDRLCVTEEGLKSLKPYKVDNAIIMAAGFASRCAPLSYERPKGLFKVRGEVLIERQIRQLRRRRLHERIVLLS